MNQIVTFTRDNTQWYFFWSHIIDAPRSYARTREEMLVELLDIVSSKILILDTTTITWQELLNKLNSKIDKPDGISKDELFDRLVQKFGLLTEKQLTFNRAGPKETCLTPEEIYDLVLKEREEQMNWKENNP